MTNAPDNLAVLAADIATLPRNNQDNDLEPVHFTTSGYEHLIAAAAARRVRHNPPPTTRLPSRP